MSYRVFVLEIIWYLVKSFFNCKNKNVLVMVGLLKWYWCKFFGGGRFLNCRFFGGGKVEVIVIRRYEFEKDSKRKYCNKRII